MNTPTVRTRPVLVLPPLLVWALFGATSSAFACVVGTGHGASCTEAALNACLPGGASFDGTVTFACGGSVTITVTSTKTISADTTIDGGGLITLSGGGTVQLLVVNAVVTLALDNVTITGGATSFGAAIDNGGTLTVTNCTFSDNRAPSDGGAIFNGSGMLTVTNSTFSRNSAPTFGGAIFNSIGTLSVTNSTFSDNGTPSFGGAIFNGSGMLTVTNSTFSGNSAASDGGAISNDGMLIVTNSTFSGNSAPSFGGAIDSSGTLSVTNSTFSDNGSPSFGGAIFHGIGMLTVTNSTFFGNSAGDGGAIFNGGVLIVTNSILANTTSGGNCSVFPGVTTDGGHNIDDGTTCGLTGAGCTNTMGTSLCNTDPKLAAALANNGGPTQTIALEAGSPAINAGDETVCAAPPVNNRDQRGFVRPGVGVTNCSMGAYEFNAAPAAGQLLVGNNFGRSDADVLSVDPRTLKVNGVFGEAKNFDPAPGAMARDSLGRIYILDTNRDRVQRFDVAGAFIDIFADSGFYVNGLYYGIAIDAADNVYIGSDGPLTFDVSDDAIVRFDINGNPLGTFGQADFATSGFRAGSPLAFDSQGNLYASFINPGANGPVIVRYAPEGTCLGTFGQANPSESGLSFVNGLAFDADGHLFVRTNNILEFDAAGIFLGTFASVSSDGGLAFDADRNLFTTERLNDRLKKFDAKGTLVSTVTDPTFHGPGNLLFVSSPTTTTTTTTATTTTTTTQPTVNTSTTLSTIPTTSTTVPIPPPRDSFTGDGVIVGDLFSYAQAIAVDANALYVAGYDGGAGIAWRIEKRSLPEGALVPSFGNGGIVISDPTVGTDVALAIALDSQYLYVAGYDEGAGGFLPAEWRIEKRALLDGTPASGFGRSGVVTSNPSSGYDVARAIAIDQQFMYVTGPEDAINYRIEKRQLSDGALVPGFGTGGVVTSPGAGAPYAIGIDGSSMYVAGTAQFSNWWHIEKRNLSDGKLVSDFGSSGGVTEMFPGVGCGSEGALALAIDSDFMYVMGAAGGGWQIEKRRASDGSLIYSQAIPESGSCDAARSIAVDGKFMYVVGKQLQIPTGQWRVEKRNLSDGTLVTGFGMSGSVVSTFGEANSVAIDTEFMYVAGTDSSRSRIEKRDLSNGALASASPTTTTQPTATTTSSTSSTSVPPARTTTSTTGPSTSGPPTTSTSTTLPCTTPRCSIDAGLTSAACAGQAVPSSVTNKFNQATSLIDKAATSSAKQARKLLKRAKKALKQAEAKASRAAKGKHAKISSNCAMVLKGAAGGVMAGLGV